MTLRTTFFLKFRLKNYRDIYSRAVRERSEQALQMSDPGQGWKPCSIQASSLAGSNPEGLPIKPEVCRNSLWNGSQVKGGALASTCWNKLRRPVRRPKGGRAEGGRRKANNAKKREAKKRLSWLRLSLPHPDRGAYYHSYLRRARLWPALAPARAALATF